MNLQIIIPIYHPDEKFLRLLESIKNQMLVNIPLLIIDSGSDNAYKNNLVGMNVRIEKIDKKEFNHGGTRQMGINICPNADIIVFLTQDAILCDENAIKNLVSVFENSTIGCAYGRQFPHKGASLFAAHARSFNYGKNSYVRSIADKEKYGIKTVFISNSFAAYRRKAMSDIGGFPSTTILSEDMYVAAKMLMKGWKIAYVAEATVYHSHDYTIWQEFKRYFDIGVFHCNESWIREAFGQAEDEGRKFIFSEIDCLYKNKPILLLEMIIRNGMKFIGYRLGTIANNLPRFLIYKFSMHHSV